MTRRRPHAPLTTVVVLSTGLLGLILWGWRAEFGIRAQAEEPGPLKVFGGPATWSFEPRRDVFDPDARFDLRSLNEPVAGAAGFVQRTEDGSGFRLGDGAPVRFWAISTYVQRQDDLDRLRHHARFLAKRGVNMVRYHGHLEPDLEAAPDAPLDRANPEAIDQAQRLVAAMKDEGIYTTISPYWANHLKRVPSRWGLQGWPEDQSPQGLLFFNETLQEAYKSWLRQLLAEPNPYTGIPLAEDPALAIFQLQNEDSMLFWTMQNVKGRQRELLGRQFADWLARKYGSLDQARAAWNGATMPEDDFENGVVGLYILWEFTQERRGGRKARLDDQLQFLAETMRGFNLEIARFLREELGCRFLINAGNWKTADPIRLGDVERWSYTANDVIAVNRYYSPVHLGPDRGWRINPGDRYEDASALFQPRDLPTNVKQVAGYPTILTETRWVPPLGYQAESVFLAAAYSSLAGIDGFYWFSTSEPEWSIRDVAEWNAASRKKWEVAQPMVVGQFPAAALAYRRGDIETGRPAVVEHRRLEDLWERRPPIIAEDPGYDPNRDLGDAARRLDLDEGVDPRAYLVGPVEVVFGSDPGRTEVVDLNDYIQGSRILSVTGELLLDAEAGLCALNAPVAQGAVGFLGAFGPVALRDLTIRCRNDYASILAVSLDGEPLGRSDEILLQIGTVAKPTGWATRSLTFEVNDGARSVEGDQIEDTGGMPWAIERAQGSVTIRNNRIRSAEALDENGLPIHALELERTDGQIRFDLPDDVLYVLLGAE